MARTPAVGVHARPPARHPLAALGRLTTNAAPKRLWGLIRGSNPFLCSVDLEATQSPADRKVGGAFRCAVGQPVKVGVATTGTASVGSGVAPPLDSVVVGVGVGVGVGDSLLAGCKQVGRSWSVVGRSCRNLVSLSGLWSVSRDCRPPIRPCRIGSRHLA